VKKALLQLILGLSLVPVCSHAELLFYRGTVKADSIGDNSELRRRWHVFLVIDHDAGTMAKLSYLPSGRLKIFTVEDLTGIQPTAVSLGHGHTNTVLAQAESSVNTNNQATVKATFASGANHKLKVNKGATLSFPGVLGWSHQGVFPSAVTGANTSVEETGVMVFDSSATVSSNSQGETLPAAEQRLRLYLQSHGFRETILN
jgi:hypothetical protein